MNPTTDVLEQRVALRRSTRYRLVREADQQRTKAIFAESVGNPLGNIRHRRRSPSWRTGGLPLIVDNTVPSPYLLRPIEHGADIVVQSLTKYLGGHGTSLGGAIIDSGKFPWAEHGPLQAPERTRHQLSRVVYTEAFGPAAYRPRPRGCRCATPARRSRRSTFQILQGIETLALRVDRIVENAVKVAGFLREHPKVEWVNYAGLPDRRPRPGAEVPGRQGAGPVHLRREGRPRGRARFQDALQLFTRLVNIGDARVAGHASGVHHAPPAQSRKSCKRPACARKTVRLSIGIEHIDDLIADLDQALAQV